MTVHSQTRIANEEFAEKTFTAEYDNNLTAEAIVTPATGKRIKVRHCYVSADSTTGKARFYFDADADGNENSLNIVYAGAGKVISGDSHTIIRGGIDEPVRLTTSFGNGTDFFVAVDYSEE